MVEYWHDKYATNGKILPKNDKIAKHAKREAFFKMCTKFHDLWSCNFKKKTKDQKPLTLAFRKCRLDMCWPFLALLSLGNPSSDLFWIVVH